MFQAWLEPQSIQPLNNAYFAAKQAKTKTASSAYAEEQGFDVIDASADDIAKLPYWERLLGFGTGRQNLALEPLVTVQSLLILVNMM